MKDDTTATCPACEGDGTVDNETKKPWSKVAPGNPRVRSGEVGPETCNQCKGRGRVPKKPAAAPATTPPKNK